jgi:hypothetical protein
VNPYSKLLTDEVSGVQVPNERWEAWEEGALAERTRIVGLFDAAWAIGGTTGDHLNVARDIIEGLREKK